MDTLKCFLSKLVKSYFCSMQITEKYIEKMQRDEEIKDESKKKWR